MLGITIIIPNYNQADALQKTLAAIKSQNYPDDWEVNILIVDNNSSDGSIKVARNFGAEILNNDIEPNPYISRNLAVGHAKSEYLVFLDANCTPVQAWLMAGIQALLDKNMDIIAGSFDVIVSVNPSFEEMAYAIMYLDNEYSEQKKGAVPAGNFFCRKEVFEKIGLFNEFRSGSDTEWSIRARKKGMQIDFEKEARVEYPAKSSEIFYKDVKRMGSGARQNWKQVKGLRKTNLIALLYFFPMSPGTFRQKLARRKLLIPLGKKLGLWFVVWRARIIFAWSMLGIA